MSVSRRTVVLGGAAVAVAAVLAVGLTLVLTRGPERPPPLPRPAYAADTVPKPRQPTAKDLPKDCGVRAATLRAHLPHADQDDTYGEHEQLRCTWRGAGHRTADRLDIEEAPYTFASETGSVMERALWQLDPAPRGPVAEGRPPRAVTGLGDEALLYYPHAPRYLADVNPGATVLFRTGAVVVAVRFEYGDDSEVPPEGRARRAAFAAAADVARALRAPATPVLTEPRPQGPPPVRRTVRPCGLVPSAVAGRLVRGARGVRVKPPEDRGRPDGEPYGLATDTCQWAAKPGPRGWALTVTARSMAEWRRGAAVPQAGRDYLERFHTAREGRGHWHFHVLRGLGDQAFAVYRLGAAASDGPLGFGRAGGEVTFRYRNLVVQVLYTGPGYPRPDPEKVIASAYAAAVGARAALAG